MGASGRAADAARSIWASAPDIGQGRLLSVAVLGLALAVALVIMLLMFWGWFTYFGPKPQPPAPVKQPTPATQTSTAAPATGAAALAGPPEAQKAPAWPFLPAIPDDSTPATDEGGDGEEQDRAELHRGH